MPCFALCCALSVAQANPSAPAPTPTPATTVTPLVVPESLEPTVSQGSALRIGARTGWTASSTQWSGGVQIINESSCFPGAAGELFLLVGASGNHVTSRIGARLSYTLWLGAEDFIGIFAAAGAAVVTFSPVGKFAAFCDRTGLEGCGGWGAGVEVGGGLRIWHFRLEAMAGFQDIAPVMIAGAFDWPLWRSEPPRSAPPPQPTPTPASPSSAAVR